MRLSFRLAGAPAFLDSARELLQRLKAPRGPLLDKIGRIFLDAVQANLAQGGRPLAGEAPWPALNPRTLAIRRGRGYGNLPPLTRTGELARSLALRIAGDRAEVSSSESWAAVLHEGGVGRDRSGRPVAVPAFRFLLAPSAAVEEIETTIEEHYFSGVFA